jgi:asparagine synthase (glutamine-hydrolysing)
MCGICGIVGFQAPEQNRRVLTRMLAALDHRGPDGEGSIISSPVAVGMRRLSIIDLPGGTQPIWNESRKLAVVFNGEIYNFRELRRELESHGHAFRTHSDTEVIVHAYEAWGDAFLQHLRGMFALALLELPSGPSGSVSRILIARDRLGIKPLYYACVDGNLLFASEIRALLASGLIPRSISPEVLSSFLLFGSVGDPATIIDGISAIPAGHFVEICPNRLTHKPEPHSYWNPGLAGAKPIACTGENASTVLRSCLENSVREHLVADVPVGIFLSGGIDSTAIAALASRQQPGIRSFTVAFAEQDHSEAAVARQTAQNLGIEHHEYLLSGDEMLDRMDEAIAAFDQPSMDGINTYFVSWAARQSGLKVALSGLGSDELFGGYPTFASAPRIGKLVGFASYLPGPLAKILSTAAERIVPSFMPADAARKLSSALRDSSALPHPLFYTRTLFPPQAVSSLLEETGQGWQATAWWQWLASTARQTDASDSFAAVSWLELRSYMLNTLLRDTDCMSMTHSLEVRVPFLDHRLVELALGLPQQQKQRGRTPKSLLIQALNGLLPEKVTQGPKRTFTLPWEKWLRGPLQSRVEEGLSGWSPHLDPWIRKKSAQDVWRDFLAGRTSWSRPWSLYVLNEWTKRNLSVPSGNTSRVDLQTAVVA